MAKIERRKFVRKAIRIPCVIQFPSGITINGNTRDLSLEGANVESTSVQGPDNKDLTLGENGLLTLKFKKGTSVDSILVQCQVLHMVANGIGLLVRFSELNKREQDLLGQMIASGKAQVD